MNKIIITNQNYKNEYIKILREKDPFANEKIYSLNEFKSSYPYSFDNHALDYIMTHYHVILDIAKIYLNNILYVPIEELHNDKGMFLTHLKSELIENKLIVKNDSLSHYLSNSEINIINIPHTKELDYLLKDFHVTYINNKTTTTNAITVYACPSLEDELIYVGNIIAKLIQNHFDIYHIYLANLTNEDMIPLERIFHLLHIPINIPSTTTISETHIGSYYLSHTLEETKKIVHNQDENDCYQQLISIINKYVDLDHKNEFIIHELEHTKVKNKTYSNAISIVDLKSYQFSDKDYVFILNLNSDTIPVNYKDEDYLTDDEKSSLNLDTTTLLNEQEKEWVTEKINQIPNKTLTYKTQDKGTTYYPSSLIADNHYQVLPMPDITYQVSHDFNKWYLASYLDNYYKYNSITSDLQLLQSNYDIPYATYDNHFNGIHSKYLPKQLSLSYTSLDTYQKCPFSYYLKYILKVEPMTTTVPLCIGNLFHEALEKRNDKDFEINTFFDSKIKESEWNAKDLYYIKKSKQDLIHLLDIINHQEKFTELHDELHEQKISIPITDNINFFGKIDKIKYHTFNNETILSIFDYKTGKAQIVANYFPLGFSLQLPSYLYLIKHSTILPNPVIGGVYIQNIIPGIIRADENKSYDQQLKNSYKYHGFSNQNQDILKFVDTSYQDSNIIASMKVKSDGDFYAYSKIWNDDDINKLCDLVDHFIKDTGENILTGKFPMTSKIINNKDYISCNYCPFKDICYKTDEDNIYLKVETGEKNGMDE